MSGAADADADAELVLSTQLCETLLKANMELKERLKLLSIQHDALSTTFQGSAADLSRQSKDYLAEQQRLATTTKATCEAQADFLAHCESRFASEYAELRAAVATGRAKVRTQAKRDEDREKRMKHKGPTTSPGRGRAAMREARERELAEVEKTIASTAELHSQQMEALRSALKEAQVQSEENTRLNARLAQTQAEQIAASWIETHAALLTALREGKGRQSVSSSSSSSSFPGTDDKSPGASKSQRDQKLERLRNDGASPTTIASNDERHAWYAKLFGPELETIDRQRKNGTGETSRRRTRARRRRASSVVDDIGSLGIAATPSLTSLEATMRTILAEQEELSRRRARLQQRGRVGSTGSSVGSGSNQSHSERSLSSTGRDAGGDGDTTGTDENKAAEEAARRVERQKIAELKVALAKTNAELSAIRSEIDEKMADGWVLKPPDDGTSDDNGSPAESNVSRVAKVKAKLTHMARRYRVPGTKTDDVTGEEDSGDGEALSWVETASRLAEFIRATKEELVKTKEAIAKAEVQELEVDASTVQGGSVALPVSPSPPKQQQRQMQKQIPSSPGRQQQGIATAARLPSSEERTSSSGAGNRAGDDDDAAAAKMRREAEDEGGGGGMGRVIVAYAGGVALGVAASMIIMRMMTPRTSSKRKGGGGSSSR